MSTMQGSGAHEVPRGDGVRLPASAGDAGTGDRGTRGVIDLSAQTGAAGLPLTPEDCGFIIDLIDTAAGGVPTATSPNWRVRQKVQELQVQLATYREQVFEEVMTDAHIDTAPQEVKAGVTWLREHRTKHVNGEYGDKFGGTVKGAKELVTR